MEETVYNIIAYLIVILALFIAGRKLFRKIFVKNESPCANGCAGCTLKCELKGVVNE